METAPGHARIRARTLWRGLGITLAVAALSLCAYAGGQRQRPGAAEAPKRASITLTRIKAVATTGKATAAGPSANVGQKIRLIGTGFDSNVSVQFTAFAGSGFAVRPLKVQNGRVQVAAPADTVTGPVKLIDPDTGTSAPLTLQIVPTISTLTPATIAPGGRLLIDGQGFAPDTKVVFAGVADPVTPTVVSPARIDILVPAGARTGRITVVTVGGKSKPARLTIQSAAVSSAVARPASPAPKAVPARPPARKPAAPKAAPTRKTSTSAARKKSKE